MPQRWLSPAQLSKRSITWCHWWMEWSRFWWRFLNHFQRISPQQPWHWPQSSWWKSSTTHSLHEFTWKLLFSHLKRNAQQSKSMSAIARLVVVVPKLSTLQWLLHTAKCMETCFASLSSFDAQFLYSLLEWTMCFSHARTAKWCSARRLITQWLWQWVSLWQKHPRVREPCSCRFMFGMVRIFQTMLVPSLMKNSNTVLTRTLFTALAIMSTTTTTTTHTGTWTTSSASGGSSSSSSSIAAAVSTTSNHNENHSCSVPIIDHDNGINHTHRPNLVPEIDEKRRSILAKTWYYDRTYWSVRGTCDGDEYTASNLGNHVGRCLGCIGIGNGPTWIFGIYGLWTNDTDPTNWSQLFMGWSTNP